MPLSDPRNAGKRSWHTTKGMWLLFLYLIMAGTSGPLLEAVFFPPAETTAFKVTSRTADRLCFAQTVEKFREMRPKFFAWSVRRWHDPDYDTDSPVTPEFIGRLDFQASDTTSKGEVRTYQQCVNLPDRLRGQDIDLIIEAVGMYRSWHGLWLVNRRVGPYLIIKRHAFEW